MQENGPNQPCKSTEEVDPSINIFKRFESSEPTQQSVSESSTQKNTVENKKEFQTLTEFTNVNLINYKEESKVNDSVGRLEATGTFSPQDSLVN